MSEEEKDLIEKTALKDVEYIIHYDPIAKAAKSAEYFAKMTIIKPIAANVYPQIYVDLVGRFDKEEATRRLKSLGLRVAKFFYCTFPKILKKPQKFDDIFVKIAKVNLHEKLSIVDKVEEKGILKYCKILVENCFFCSEIPPIENIEIPYCQALAGTYQNLYNLKSLYNKDLEPRLVKIDAIKSAEYEGDQCEYLLSVIG